MTKNILLYCIVFFSAQVMAADLSLSEIAFYNRCFSHLTTKSPGLNDPHLSKIVAGTMSAEEACLSVLRSAKLQSNGRIRNQNDQTARDVLNTFYAAHSHWFMDSTLAGVAAINNSGLVDPSTGSVYLTKALFDPNFKYQDIFDGAKSYEAIRVGSTSLDGRTDVDSSRRLASVMISTDPKNNNYNYPVYIYGRHDVIRSNNPDVPDTYRTTGKPWTGIRFKPHGDLIGFRDEPTLTVPGTANAVNTPRVFNGSKGGGILGNRDYVMRTLNLSSINSDGGLNMPRRFGRAIFKDFTCRDLPVINLNTDTAPYIDSNARDIPFRTNRGCVGCHVSMDQISGLVRAYSTTVVGINRAGTNIGRIEVDRPPTISAPFSWPTKSDPDYWKKTPSALFVYRTLDNQLITRDVANFNALGNIFKQLDDTYLCAASRYFKHFTNIEYPVELIMGPLYQNDKNALFIRQLASELKSHQDPMKTIESILTSDIYRHASFGMEE